MKPLRSLVLALVAALSFSACLQDEKVVKLKPDGSGTIEEKLIMSKAVIEQMNSMASGFGALGGDKAAKPFSLLDEGKLKDAADKMGDGVTFVSAKPLSTPDGEGYLATYAFEDINKVRLKQDLGDKMPSGSGGMMKMKPGKEEAVKFQFVKSSLTGPASLKIKMPEIKDEDVAKAQKDKPQAPDSKDEMMAAMMQQMFKDLKIKTSIEFQGQIVDTNATYREGAGVTLAEMDFNKVLANPEKFKALTKANPKSLDDAKALVKDVDGIKVETLPEVMVKFK